MNKLKLFTETVVSKGKKIKSCKKCKVTPIETLIVITDYVPTEEHSPLLLVHSQYADNFVKCVTGYHYLNTDPINETVWEAINCQVLASSGCAVQASSSGSHSSGRDIVCELGGISNKSAKYSKGKTEFAISSYRLTTVCSDKDCGTIESIVSQINSRKNYEYYSFIVRNETVDTIEYDWYMIPSNEPVLSPEYYEWEPMIGQRGKNAGQQVGWKTNELNGSKMTITFSMSSQLWITIEATPELKKYIVSSCIVSNKAKFNYLQIFEMFK
jgi:hypothetical protein